MSAITKKTDGLSMQEAADHIGVHLNTIFNWVKSGKLPVTRIGPTGRIVRIHPDDLDRMVQAPQTTGGQTDDQ